MFLLLPVFWLGVSAVRDLGLALEGGRVDSLADLNSDLISDILYKGDTSFRVYIFDPSEQKFQMKTEVPVCDEGEKLVSLMVTDFNLDGHSDIIATSQREGSPTFHIRFFGQVETLDESMQFAQEYEYEAGGSHPFLVDANADGVMDLFDGESLNFYSSQSGLTPSNSLSFINVTLNTPHFSSVTDFDGDCRADLVLDVFEGGVRQLWIYLGQYVGFQEEPLKIRLNADASTFGGSQPQLAFFDVNSDGSQDILAPFEDSVGVGFYVRSNKVLPPCEQQGFLMSLPDNCQNAETLCKKSAWTTSNGFQDPQTIYIWKNEWGSQWKFVKEAERPYILSVGDFDIDGFPDVSVLMEDASGHREIWVLQNTGLNENHLNVCSSDHEHSTQSRRFCIYRRIPSIPEGGPWQQVVFFDWKNQGVLKLLAVSSQQAKMIDLDANTFDYFHLKLNAKQPACSTPRFGAPYTGASFAINSQNLNNHQFIRTGTQAAQTAYGPGQLPFVYIGLGRFSSYIDNLHFAAGRSSRLFTLIIPNTHILFNPCPIDAPLLWTAKFDISPSAQKFNVVLGTAAVLAFLGFIIIFLDFKERSKARKESRRLFASQWYV